ncbi:MAG: glycine cleavage system protein H [Ignavibacteriales bacterium]|nr:glycine cleavage system protein H [Ignavibacteriales bacterium]
MTIILILLTVAIFIVLELIKNSKKQTVTSPWRITIPAPIATQVIERYFHPGHSWALVGKSDVVTVGVDDFAQRVIGELDEIELPLLGKSLKQGEPFVMLRRGKRTLVQVAPLSGVVVGVNEKLAWDPKLVNNSVYERGWVGKLQPANLRTELRNLLKGVFAERWQESVRAQLILWFSPKVGTVLQDGGHMIRNIGDLLEDEDWERLTKEFFSTVSPSNHNQTNIKEL